MQELININIAVDVIKALSERTLERSIYLMDDSLLGSSGMGSGSLTTFCLPGQTIRWMVYPIDLQAVVSIKKISFAPALGGETGTDYVMSDECAETDHEAKEWIGVLSPMEQGRRYTYRLELWMGKGINGCMAIHTPSLIWPFPLDMERETGND